jgi:hypothetical protein
MKKTGNPAMRRNAQIVAHRPWSCAQAAMAHSGLAPVTLAAKASSSTKPIRAPLKLARQMPPPLSPMCPLTKNAMPAAKLLSSAKAVTASLSAVLTTQNAKQSKEK